MGYIEGYCGNREFDLKRMFVRTKRFCYQSIKYNIYINHYGKMVAQIQTQNFGPVDHYIQYFDIGCLLEDIFLSEHRAKMFVIKTVRKIFEENDID